MGTRYGDQPPEHWAPPESLDPTPVWKQYVLVAVLLFLSLGLIAAVSAFALAAQLVPPPAVVPGGRVVLARAEAPPSGELPRRFGAPLLAEEDAFWLIQPAAGELVAVSAWWRPPDGAAPCPVGIATARGSDGAVFRAGCAAEEPTFGPRGAPLAAPRGLDRYLVSVDGERVIVNVSRPIRGFGATPQPKVSPLVDR
jgi:hypothetical protein